MNLKIALLNLLSFNSLHWVYNKKCYWSSPVHVVFDNAFGDFLQVFTVAHDTLVKIYRVLIFPRSTKNCKIHENTCMQN